MFPAGGAAAEHEFRRFRVAVSSVFGPQPSTGLLSGRDVERARIMMKLLMAVAMALGVGTSAWADVVVRPDGSYQQIEEHRAIVVDQGPKDLLIEELWLQSSTPRAVWIKPFTPPPEFQTAPQDPFGELSRGTTVYPPHNQAVRDRVFGPSVVTLLSQRLFPNAELDLPEGPRDEVTRDLQIIEQALFSGTIYTSTITRQHVLPQPMQDWLQSHGFTLTQHLIADLSAHMNRGSSVSLSLLADAAPGSPGRARVGPVQRSLPAHEATFPTLRRTDPALGQTTYELYVIGPDPLVPRAYATLWDEEPWIKKELERGRFETRYARPLEDTGAVLIDLEQRLGITLPPTPFLVRSRFKQGSEALGEIAFEPAERFVLIPAQGSRGGALDLFYCILLGLTPLIYTPESWFLMWLGARARDRMRSGQTAFGARLWPLFSIGVGVYWTVMLPGAARLAAAIPLVLGIALLVMPRTDTRAPRVRVNFEKKKKKKT